MTTCFDSIESSSGLPKDKCMLGSQTLKRLGSQHALYILIHWICSLEGLMMTIESKHVAIKIFCVIVVFD